MRNCFLCFFLLTMLSSCEKMPTSINVLDNSITYHDPEGRWPRFNSQFQLVMTTPDKPSRTSDITINLPNNSFNISYLMEGNTLRYSLNQGECHVYLNDQTTIPDSLAHKYALNCDRAKLWRDYYTYLYGLPMKLKDPGTHLDPIVEKVSFHGKTCWRIKVTYDENIGKDVWFFYLNLNTFALEAYQFYKGDPLLEGKDTGEYILLSDEVLVDGIRMPKNRKWYYNKDNTYLGQDVLNVK